MKKVCTDVSWGNQRASSSGSEARPSSPFIRSAGVAITAHRGMNTLPSPRSTLHVVPKQPSWPASSAGAQSVVALRVVFQTQCERTEDNDENGRDDEQDHRQQDRLCGRGTRFLGADEAIEAHLL